MTISALPTPPSRADSPADFSSKTDALLEALPALVTEINATTVDVTSKQVTASAASVTATTKADEALASADAAALSATTASDQAIISTASAVAAAASYDAFSDIYLGSKTASPSLDNDSNPLLVGALYWNSITSDLRVYTGSIWAVVDVSTTAYLAKGGDTMTGALTFGTGITLPANMTAAQARAATISAASGANTDITSLGAVTGVTATLGDNTTKLATTAFVQSNARSAGLFYKDSTTSSAFTKTAANTASIKAGTIFDVLGTSVTFAAATAIVMPTLTAGTDYAIYACTDGTVRADSSFTAPSGYTVANSRLIGGFHFGLVGIAETVAGGSFNTAGSVQTGGMVWTQPDVDKIRGINEYSFWDLKWRCNTSDLRAQKGFSITAAGIWVADYHASTDTDTNGLSKYNTNVASGTVLPKIPAVMGGNGTLTYADFNWWRASEMARAYGARLLTDAEANIAFFGVTENQSLGGAASTIPLTTRAAGYTSKYGVEQATGHHWVWGDDSNGTTSAYQANGGRGQSYASGVYKVILGGFRDNAANSGSRTSNWSSGPADSGWSIGLRAACDHLMLV